MPLARSIARNIILAQAKENISANQIIKNFRALGGSMRRQDALGLIRSVRNFVKYQPQISALPGNNTVPKGWLFDQDLARPYKYRVYVDATYLDPITGEEFTEVRSFYTNDYLKKDDYAADFYENAPRLETTPYYTLIGVNVTGGEHNAGMPY